MCRGFTESIVITSYSHFMQLPNAQSILRLRKVDCFYLLRSELNSSLCLYGKKEPRRLFILRFPGDLILEAKVGKAAGVLWKNGMIHRLK